MERKSSRIWLWVLAVAVGIIVIAGGALTIYIVSENDSARERRCADVVEERRGDRLLWMAIFDTFDGAEAIATLRQIVDQYKPPLECNENHIPVEVEP